MPKKISTETYQLSHGRIPWGRGSWGFKRQGSNECECQQCRDENEFWHTGLYTEARSALPTGEWELLP